MRNEIQKKSYTLDIACHSDDRHFGRRIFKVGHDSDEAAWAEWSL